MIPSLLQAPRQGPCCGLPPLVLPLLLMVTMLVLQQLLSFKQMVLLFANYAPQERLQPPD